MCRKGPKFDEWKEKSHTHCPLYHSDKKALLKLPACFSSGSSFIHYKCFFYEVKVSSWVWDDDHITLIQSQTWTWMSSSGSRTGQVVNGFWLLQFLNSLMKCPPLDFNQSVSKSLNIDLLGNLWLSFIYLHILDLKAFGIHGNLIKITSYYK